MTFGLDIWLGGSSCSSVKVSLKVSVGRPTAPVIAKLYSPPMTISVLFADYAKPTTTANVLGSLCLSIHIIHVQ